MIIAIEDFDINDVDKVGDDDDDIYIMMQCLCICLSRKIITSHFRAECQRRKVSGLWPSNDDDDDDDDDPLVTQCYTVARTTMGDMTD